MRIRGAFSESGTDSQGRHRTAPVHVADLPSGAGARQVPPIVFLKRATEEAGPKGAERVAHPRHRRAQIAQSSIRVPADCAHHLADVRGRHRQERRAPRAGETLSSSPGRNRALVVVVRRTHDRRLCCNFRAATSGWTTFGKHRTGSPIMPSDNPFKWRQFEPALILQCVRWYLRYALSYRDLEDMMRERGLCVDHTTIYRWVQRYAPEIDKRCRPFLRRTNDSYRIDETYVRVAGAWTYLYRGVDSNGDTLDFLLRATRDRKAAIAFFRKTLGAAHTTPPRVVTVDKNPAYPVAFEAVRHEGLVRPRSNLRQCKYLNNIIEAGPPIHQTPHPADAGLQAIHHGVADLARHRDHACAPQGTGAMDGEGRRGRADAADPQGVRIGRVTRSTQRILARDPKPCNRTPGTKAPRWPSTPDCESTAGCTYSSATPVVRGSGLRTKTPTACCASTSPKVLTSVGTALATSLLSRPHSTADRGRLSVGEPPPKSSTNCYSHTNENVLRRPLESGMSQPWPAPFVDAIGPRRGIRMTPVGACSTVHILLDGRWAQSHRLEAIRNGKRSWPVSISACASSWNPGAES